MFFFYYSCIRSTIKHHSLSSSKFTSFILNIDLHNICISIISTNQRTRIFLFPYIYVWNLKRAIWLVERKDDSLLRVILVVCMCIRISSYYLFFTFIIYILFQNDLNLDDVSRVDGFVFDGPVDRPSLSTQRPVINNMIDPMTTTGATPVSITPGSEAYENCINSCLVNKFNLDNLIYLLVFL